MPATPRNFCLLSIVGLLFPLAAFALEQQPVTSSVVPVYFDLEATLEAVNQSTISAQTSGAITAIYVDVNDRVEANTLLLRIDDIQQQAALEQARANLAQAEAQNTDAQLVQERNRRLFKQGSLSQGELDSSQARAKGAAAMVKAAQAGLKQAQEQLTYTQVKAPYAGIVSARHVQMGELVSPGQALLTGLALEPLRATTDVPQRVADVLQNDKISVFVGLQQITPEQVVLFPYADAQHHSVKLRVQLPTPSVAKLYPGQWAKVRVQTGERVAIRVPESAVLQRSELTSVYVQVNGQPRLRQVRIGERANQQVEVLAGLSAGEIIIVDALAQLAVLAQGD